MKLRDGCWYQLTNPDGSFKTFKVKYSFKDRQGWQYALYFSDENRTAALLHGIAAGWCEHYLVKEISEVR